MLALDMMGQDALSAAGQAIGALGDGTTFSGTGGNAKTTAAAQLVALQKLQNVQAAAQGRLPGEVSRPRVHHRVYCHLKWLSTVIPIGYYSPR
jgi:hypothetical protein